MEKILEIIAQGGVFIAPIALASVVAAALFVERMWYLRGARIVPNRLVFELDELIRRGDLYDAYQLCLQSDAPLAKVVQAGLHYVGRPRELISRVMEEAGRRELYFMRRNTAALGAIATIAPLMGLLGTVVGMIEMFQAVVDSAQESGGAANVADMAGGIWRALLTTAAGLVVAIPAYLGHRYLQTRILRHAVLIEEFGRHVMDFLVGESETPNHPHDEDNTSSRAATMPGHAEESEATR